jgi:hypothetical protein
MSTGIGVRPREGRVEITADFTPDPDLMIAATSLITGIVIGVTKWANHDLGQLAAREIPVIAGFKPRAHTSRKGYLARFDCFPKNPSPSTQTALNGCSPTGARLVCAISATKSPLLFTERSAPSRTPMPAEHVFAVLDGRARSLLDFAERPPRMRMWGE